jgi:hypothetical protein
MSNLNQDFIWGLTSFSGFTDVLDTDYKIIRLEHSIFLAIRYQLTYIRAMKRDIPKSIREYMANIGRIGGKAKGVGKGFASSEQARAAVMARWNKVKSEQKEKT